jgi:hypothetical protein
LQRKPEGIVKEKVGVDGNFPKNIVKKRGIL